MHEITPGNLWLGHAGDVRDVSGLHGNDIEAVVDLAVEEPPAALTRGMTYCRFPLVDGTGNLPGLLKAAVVTTAELIRTELPLLVACSAGMSRSPAVLACALSLVRKKSPEEMLREIASVRSADVMPGLWLDLSATVKEARDGTAG